MGWIEEHGEDYEVPGQALHDAHLTDLSWHNDASPSFGANITDPLTQDIHDLRVWIEHPDPTQREQDHRYIVNYNAWSATPVELLVMSDEDDLYAGESLEEALMVYRGALGTIQAEVGTRTEIYGQALHDAATVTY